jgi:uncharacterized protein (DUF1499 family)
MHDSVPQRSRTRYLPRAALLLDGVILIILFAAPLSGLRPLTLFQGFALTLFLCLLTAIISIVALLWGLVKHRRPMVLNALAGAVIAATPILIGVFVLGPGRIGAPPIHDISTDLIHPPAFSAARKLRSAGENSTEYGGTRVAAIQRRAYPDIQPLLSSLTPAQAFARAAQTARRLGWRLVNKDPAAGRIEATDSTPLFHFTDDIVVRIQPRGTGSRIDVRSASRVGVGDFGANAARIRHFVHTFRKTGNAPVQRNNALK